MPSLLNRIGNRRLGAPAKTPSAHSSVLIAGTVGGVVTLGADREPISEILVKARTLGRPARQTEYLHVSDLLGKCMRKFAIVESLGMQVKSQGLSLTDSLTYAQGDAIHDVIKARVASGAPRSAWGNWACRCRTTKTAVPCLAKDVTLGPCPACGGAVEIYQEVSMRNEEFKIVGNPDLLTYIDTHDALHITELKSMGHDNWKELARPDPDHVIQALFYWFLMHHAGYRLTNKVSIVYITKGWMFSGAPYKEFVVEAQGQIARLDIYLEEARRMKLFRGSNMLPARICVSDTAPVARKCEVCKVCFNTNNETPTTVSIDEALGGSSPRRAGIKRPVHRGR